MPKDEMRDYRPAIMDILADYRDDYKFDIGEAYDEIKYHSRKYFAQTGSNRKRRNLSTKRKPIKRKLSAWNKFVKANSKKPRFRFANGKLKLRQMGIAFRKTPAGRKRKR